MLVIQVTAEKSCFQESFKVIKAVQIWRIVFHFLLNGDHKFGLLLVSFPHCGVN